MFVSSHSYQILPQISNVDLTILKEIPGTSQNEFQLQHQIRLCLIHKRIRSSITQTIPLTLLRIYHSCYGVLLLLREHNATSSLLRLIINPHDQIQAKNLSLNTHNQYYLGLIRATTRPSSTNHWSILPMTSLGE